MEKYISVVETAERWNVSPRRIQILCNENRIKGAKKQSGIWFIPYGAKKPERIKSGVKNEENKVRFDLSRCFSAKHYISENSVQNIRRADNPQRLRIIGSKVLFYL